MDDRTLLALTCAGDVDAFGELFDRHIRSVLAFARSRLRGHADADDVAQAAFVLLWEKRRELELASESALPWLLGTARLLALAATRTAAKRGLSLDAAADAVDGGPNPERASEIAELERQVDVAIAGLDDTDREVYRLCVEEERSYTDAAAALGLRPSTLRGRLARLRRRLRAELDLLKGP